MKELERYSLIKEKFKREFILLQGKGCVYKGCKFCDYYNDVSDNPYEINKPVLDKVTGETGVLDIINSGSCFELDDKTIELIQKKVRDLKIHTIWFEAHWMYRNRLSEFRKLFKNSKVKFRIGAETFDPTLRASLSKGIPKNIGALEISKYFDGACLLVGIKGQTRDIIKSDIELARKYFEYYSVNVFVENSTDIKRDEELIDWFKNNLLDELFNDPKAEVLINNTDLGVG